MAIQMDRIAALSQGRDRRAGAPAGDRGGGGGLPHRGARRFPDRRLRARCRRRLPGAARAGAAGSRATTARCWMPASRGDTSAGGLARLDWMLADQPSHVIVELGGNDGLRALPPEQMAAEPRRDHHAPQGRGHPGAADRHAGAAQSRPRLRRRVRGGVPAARARSTTCRSTRSSSTASRARPCSTRATASTRPPRASRSSSSASCRPSPTGWTNA